MIFLYFAGIAALFSAFYLGKVLAIREIQLMIRRGHVEFSIFGMSVEQVYKLKKEYIAETGRNPEDL